MGFDLLLLILIALIGGVCITTIGPGGIFVTIALYAIMMLDPGTVAGTASAMFIATGAVGSLAYLRSGHLEGQTARHAAYILSGASVIGAFSGAQINALLDVYTFGLLLGGFVILTGLIILIREWRGLATVDAFDLGSTRSWMIMALVGVLVGLPGGLLGVGGPVLAVPLLVVLGLPMLMALALAQVQSIFISLFATVGYAIQGTIDWWLVLVLGIPLIIGTVGGWWVAQRINPSRLKLVLGLVLLALGIHLLTGGAVPN